MSRRVLVLTVLLAGALCLTCAPTVADAQWGVGGLSTFRDMSEILKKEIDPLESMENAVGRDPNAEDEEDNAAANKDVLDEIRSLDEPVEEGDDLGTGGGGTSGGGSKKSADDAARHQQMYSVQWMPSARPGFVVPEIYRRQLTADMTEGMDDADPEEEEREQARRSMPKSTPGKSEESKAMDKCLRQVSKFCSFTTMTKDFASFATCCFDVRHHVKANCFEWCENHGRCAPDMRAHCPNLPPSETTECLLKAQSARKLSQDCIDSPHFKSMEEGAEDMRESNRLSQEAAAPAQPTNNAVDKEGSDDEEDINAGVPTEDDDDTQEDGDVDVTKPANYGSGDEL